MLARIRGNASSCLPAAAAAVRLSCAGGEVEALVWWRERIGRNGCRRLFIVAVDWITYYFQDFCFNRYFDFLILILKSELRHSNLHLTVYFLYFFSVIFLCILQFIGFFSSHFN